MESPVISFLVSLSVLGFLVMVHELGHMVVARRSGVRILRFSIGFGPKIFSWKRGETEYAISAIPLGGYVKMAGEHHGERSNRPWEYLSKPIGVRAKIIVAGPLVNYVVALATLWIVFLIGYPEMLPVVGKTMAEMPARAAGLQENDRIKEIDGAAIGTWDDMSEIIAASADKPLTFSVEREGAVRRVQMTPRLKDITDPLGRRRTVGLIGIEPKGDFEYVRAGPVEAVWRTIEQQNEWVVETFVAFRSLLTGRLSMQDSMTGPIGIMYLTSEAVQIGIMPVLFIASLLSLSLAIFNLLPIPILDGGHLFFLALEKLRGKPVSINIQERSAQVSMVLLLALVLTTCVNDVTRYGLLDRIIGWFRG